MVAASSAAPDELCSCVPVNPIPRVDGWPLSSIILTKAVINRLREVQKTPDSSIRVGESVTINTHWHDMAVACIQ